MIAWLRKLFHRSPKKKVITRLSREAILLDIEPRSEVMDAFPYRSHLSDHELWEMGWNDAVWHHKPNPKFINNKPYMWGWKEAKGN